MPQISFFRYIYKELYIISFMTKYLIVGATTNEIFVFSKTNSGDER